MEVVGGEQGDRQVFQLVLGANTDVYRVSVAVSKR